MCRFSSMSALFFVACALFAQTASRSSSPDAPVIWDPPAWPFLQKTPKATVSKEMVAAVHVSDFPVILGKTKMEDVKSTLGGTIGQKGDAGNFDEWLCFYGEDSGGRWALWLESGEINGGTVGSFQWRRLNEGAALDGRCQMLGEAKVQLPIKLRLGITEEEVLKILGPPTVKRGDGLIYFHEHHLSIRGTPYTSDNAVAIVLRGALAWAIKVSKTTVS